MYMFCESCADKRDDAAILELMSAVASCKRCPSLSRLPQQNAALCLQYVDIRKGITKEQAQRLASNLEFSGDQLRQATDQIMRLYELFIKVDCTQVEINPFAVTPEGQVVCFDAKLNFDDNAAFRQKDIFAMDNTAESDPR